MQPVRIAVLNLKGGTGKTTTSVYLAAALALSGRTLLIDTDPQHSALSWSEAAGGFPFQVVGLPVRDLRNRIDGVGEGYTHVVIDTTPSDTSIVRSAALATDIALITQPPGLIDVDRLAPTLELLAELDEVRRATLRVLLTKVRGGTRTASAARQLLAELELPVLPHEIPLREAYNASFGLIPSDLRHYQPVVDELLSLRSAA